jgi:hypothetical protein
MTIHPTRHDVKELLAYPTELQARVDVTDVSGLNHGALKRCEVTQILDSPVSQ